MVKRLLTLCFLSLFVFSLMFASELTATLGLDVFYAKGKMASYNLDDSLCRANFSLKYLKTLSSVKGEVKFCGSFVKTTDKLSPFIKNQSYSLERAYTKFKLTLFEDKKTTFTLGKAPISWGKGYYYRVGDVLVSDSLSTDKVGETPSRDIWLIAIDQSFLPLFKLSIGYSLPLENQNRIIGLNLSRDFDIDALKEIYLYYGYDITKDMHKVSLAIDGTLYFDYILGLEYSYLDYSNLTAVLNMLKNYSFDINYNSHSLSLYLCSKYALNERKLEVLASTSLSLSDRTNLSISALSLFEKKVFENVALNVGTTTTLNENINLDVGASYILNKEKNGVYLLKLSLSSTF